MVDNERLFKLYEAMMNSEEFISTKEIKELGFTQAEIAKMVEEETLIRVKRGFYNFGNVNSLFMYGKSLIDSKQRSSAIKVFEKCFSLDKTNIYAAYQLFINSVKVKDYDNVLKYFDVLYEHDPENKRYLYYLYILSYIIELPQYYKDIVKNLSYKEMTIYEHDEYTQLINNTISLVMNSKISHAYRTRSDYHSNHPSSFEDYAEITLLKEATYMYGRKKKLIQEAVEEDRFDDVHELFGQMSSVRELPIFYKYMAYLVDDIIHMINFKEVSEVANNSQGSNVFAAIDNYDYDLALELARERDKNSGFENKSIMVLLLEKVVAKKKELLGEKVETSVEEVVEETIEEVAVQREEVIDQCIQLSMFESEFNHLGLIMLLKENKLEEFEQYLINYLHATKNDHYYKFIMYLIKICKIEEDYNYINVLAIITQITACRYEFSSIEYVTKYYEELTKGNFDKAKIYVKILSEFNALDEDTLSDLYELIGTSKARYNEKVVVQPVQEVVEEKVENPVDVVIDTAEEVENPVVEQKTKFVPIAKTFKYKDKETEEYRQEVEYINGKLEQLNVSRGLIVLKPMDNIRRKRIHNIIEDRKDAVTFSIGEGDNRRIVIRYIGNVYVPLKETIAIADKAYYSKDYETALRAYLDILGTNNPKTFIYAKVGLTYMKMWKIDKAIEYLKVATELSKVNNEKFDFSDLIASLDGTIEQGEKKPKFRMKLSDFEGHLDNFGVDRFEEMLIHKEINDLSYEGACEELGFTYEEYLLSLLLLAKRNFTNKQDEIGEKFLKMVEQSGNKSKKVIAKMEEVRKNKKFYKNRAESQGVSMVMKSSE